MSTEHKPGLYVKGDKTRRANTVADAVQAVWDGFIRAEEPKAEAPKAADKTTKTKS